jgi:hypothetical protein
MAAFSHRMKPHLFGFQTRCISSFSKDMFVANFARNENNFDVCHQAAHPLRESGGGNLLAIQRLFFPIKTTIMSQMEFGTAFLALGGLDCLCPIQHDRL